MSGKITLPALKRQYVVSYNPVIEGDINLICADREPDKEDLYWIRQAKAVILPQGCKKSLFEAVVQNCPNVFPDYKCRFIYPGKTGQIRMFRLYGFPHPKSLLFGSLTTCPYSIWKRLSFPVVVKSISGGEGEGVFLVNDFGSVNMVLEKLRSYEKAGIKGFIIQRYIPNNSMDLRVVIIYDEIHAYWRKAQSREMFYHNVSRGSKIEYVDIQKDLPSAYNLVCNLRRRTGINLAGIDLIFSSEDTTLKKPYILEINYYFGRKGLGGDRNYYKLLNKAVQRWLNKLD